MTDDTTPVIEPTANRRYWPLFFAGVVCFVVGPALYVLQMQQKLLWMPWYVPILATIGVVFMMMSVWRHPGFVRIAGLIFFALLCIFQWFITAVAIRVPEYTGPALPDREIPAFTTRLANGSSFTDNDLRNGKPSLLVFFRGRW